MGQLFSKVCKNILQRWRLAEQKSRFKDIVGGPQNGCLGKKNETFSIFSC